LSPTGYTLAYVYDNEYGVQVWTHSVQFGLARFTEVNYQ